MKTITVMCYYVSMYLFTVLASYLHAQHITQLRHMPTIDKLGLALFTALACSVCVAFYYYVRDIISVHRA